VENRDEPIDWRALADSIGADPEFGGVHIARRAIAFSWVTRRFAAR
jgi:hypothetical protein